MPKVPKVSIVCESPRYPRYRLCANPQGTTINCGVPCDTTWQHKGFLNMFGCVWPCLWREDNFLYWKHTLGIIVMRQINIWKSTLEGRITSIGVLLVLLKYLEISFRYNLYYKERRWGWIEGKWIKEVSTNLRFCIKSRKQTIENDGKCANNWSTYLFSLHVLSIQFSLNILKDEVKTEFYGSLQWEGQFTITDHMHWSGLVQIMVAKGNKCSLEDAMLEMNIKRHKIRVCYLYPSFSGWPRLFIQSLVGWTSPIYAPSTFDQFAPFLAFEPQ